jgi:FOG: WD40-like repeat
MADSPDPKLDQWTTFRNGPHNHGLAQTQLPLSLEVKWSLETPDGTASTAVISGGRVYMGALCGDVYCIDLKSGEVIWTYKSIDEVEPNGFAPGFNAPAAIDDSRVYLGDDQGTFHVIDRQTGRRIWTAETGAEIVGGAQFYGDRVLFGSHDGLLYCHEAATGKLIWKTETKGPVNATPCLSEKYTFTTGCDQPILRVMDVETGQQVSEIPLGSLLIASPAIWDDILYFGTGDGIVYALDWKKKSIVWQFSIPGRDQQMASSPALTEELLVIGSRDKHVYCLERGTGTLKWSFKTRAKVDSSPVIAGDRVYFGSADRTVYGLDLKTGEPVWKTGVERSVTGSPAIAQGCLVIGTDSAKGKIFCFGGA